MWLIFRITSRHLPARTFHQTPSCSSLFSQGVSPTCLPASDLSTATRLPTMWFFLIGPVGLVNTIAHFTFPFLAGTAYFPGLLTVILPTTFGTALALRIIRDGRQQWFARTPSSASLPATVRAD